MNQEVKDLGLAPRGKTRIEWADAQMPVLRTIRQRFATEQPLKGLKIGACLHVTSETANLVRTLKDGGAEVWLCASNPLSTQDDVAASLAVDYGIPTYAIKGEDHDTYYRHLEAVLTFSPNVTLDDGADLVTMVHTKKQFQPLLKGMIGGMEETTTGVVRLRAMEKDGSLAYPIISVNDAATKYLFDNRYGTGQSTVDGIIRATNILLAGKTVVTAGYGWCGRGFALRARGLGAKVVVTEVDPIRALEAAMDGFEVMPMEQAAKEGDIFCTLTGNKSVLRKEHFSSMKNGAVLCNSGHFNVEIDIPALKALSKSVRQNIRDLVDEYLMPDGRALYLLAEGRLVNLSCAEGHPAVVMDMSFATQAMMAEYVSKNATKMAKKVLAVPREVEDWIARTKLATMGVSIDALTKEQREYLASWHEGT